MTAAECEIVADAGLRLEELAGRLWRTEMPDAMLAAMDVKRISGLLSALPLTTEPDDL